MGKKESFEASLKALEKVVEKLEDGGAPLEESLELFEEGRQHAKVCAEKLNQVERKVQLLLEGEKGEPVTRELDEEETEAKADPVRDDFPQ